MAFYDEARIKVISGKGGDGCVSFRREKYIPKGGPDGGDGGKGGDVYIQLDSQLNSLVTLKGKKTFAATPGKGGQGKNMKGHSGKDEIILVPEGTIIFHKETNEQIGEITLDNPKILVAKGGKGGLGNARFKSSTNQAPRKNTLGEKSDERNLYLELRLIADVGLLGLPNAGKSSLINAITNSKSKIGSYEFTTLSPSLGILKDEQYTISIADLPGLIEGASEGMGLGLKFLKHAYRTKLLIHIVDGSAGIEDAMKSYLVIENELKKFYLDFTKQERWICISKIDLMEKDLISLTIQTFQEKYPTVPIFSISSKNNEGLELLSDRLLSLL